MTPIELAIAALEKIAETQTEKPWNGSGYDVDDAYDNGQFICAEMAREALASIKALPTPSQRAGSDTEGAEVWKDAYEAECKKFQAETLRFSEQFERAEKLKESLEDCVTWLRAAFQSLEGYSVKSQVGKSLAKANALIASLPTTPATSDEGEKP